MRAVLARQAEQDVPREDESEQLLRLLQGAGFGIARRSYPPCEVIEQEAWQADPLYRPPAVPSPAGARGRGSGDIREVETERGFAWYRG